MLAKLWTKLAIPDNLFHFKIILKTILDYRATFSYYEFYSLHMLINDWKGKVALILDCNEMLFKS